MAVERVLRYLRHRPKCPLQLNLQDAVVGTALWVDSDWANDELSRRSTSGGIVRRGEHSITWLSRKQSRVALSSCEAELNAISRRCACGGSVKLVIRLEPVVPSPS